MTEAEVCILEVEREALRKNLATALRALTPFAEAHAKAAVLSGKPGDFCPEEAYRQARAVWFEISHA
jgi:hypothetical protein